MHHVHKQDLDAKLSEKKKAKIASFRTQEFDYWLGLPSLEFFRETQYSLFARTSLVGEEKKSD
jgi:hypothetical protein